jgi:hypothetical protein
MSKTAESKVFSTREEWLVAFAAELEPIIKSRAGLSRKAYRIACGWPSKGGTKHANRRIGECWSPDASASDTAEIFISPTLSAVDEVAHVALHELLHAFLPTGTGHRKPFSQAAKKVGLVGKPTATEAGEALAATLKAITDKLGPYPHEQLNAGGPKEKGRNLKFQCPDCGYIGRTSAMWLDTVGAPICPQCNVQMISEDELIDEDFVKMEIIEQHSEFRIPGDTRFRVRMSRAFGQKDTAWFILDYSPEQSTEGHATPLRWVAGKAVEALDIEPAYTPARLTPAESRQDALDLIEALRDGLLTYQMLDEDQDELAQQDAEWLDDSEDEVPDYEDGDLDPEAEAACADETARREAWVVAKG